MDILGGITEFIRQVIAAIGFMLTWMADLATQINAIQFESSTVEQILALYRYLVGDVIYLMTVTACYVSIFLMAIRVVPKFVSWWKDISPLHS